MHGTKLAGNYLWPPGVGSYCSGHTGEVHHWWDGGQDSLRIPCRGQCCLPQGNLKVFGVLETFFDSYSLLFKVFPVIHSLLDAKITNVLGLCHDKTILAAVQVRINWWIWLSWSIWVSNSDIWHGSLTWSHITSSGILIFYLSSPFYVNLGIKLTLWSESQ